MPARPLQLDTSRNARALSRTQVDRLDAQHLQAPAQPLTPASRLSGERDGLSYFPSLRDEAELPGELWEPAMGYNIRFIAFRDEPDVAAFQSQEWLTDYRLFKRAGRDEWHIEGPSLETGGVTLFAEIAIDASKAPDLEMAAAAARKLDADLKPWGGAVLDRDTLTRALMLSKVHKDKVLAISADDDEMDSALVCDNGAVVGGRVLTLSELVEIAPDSSAAPANYHADDYTTAGGYRPSYAV